MFVNLQTRRTIACSLILTAFVYTIFNFSITHLSKKLSNSSLTTETRLVLDDKPKEAFVTFCNNNRNYLALLSVILDSIHEFSTRPIIAYGIDVDLNLDTKKYPRLIKRRLNRGDCGPSIYFCKIAAILESEVDYGIYVEADTLVNWNVDILFDVLHQWPYDLPLAPRHPDDPMNYKHFLNEFNLGFENRTTPYIHAHLLWTYRAYPFFQQAQLLFQQGRFLGANFDETGMNILLWKAKSNHTLCKIDPYFSYLPAYELNEKKCSSYCHTAYMYIHGSKSARKQRNLLDRLKKHVGAPFIQTPSNGMHYLNETQYTCCYPDSKRSLIHPLLCEHNIKKEK